MSTKAECTCRIEYCGKAAGIIPCPLCAAAPDLLEACKEALVVIPHSIENDETIKNITRAVASAEKE